MSATIARQTATRFLKSGTIPKDADLNALISACDQTVRNLTHTSATKAVELGRAFVQHAAPLGREHRLTALRASGWAELVAGNYKEAQRAYSGARRLLHRDPISRARIDRVLIDVFMYLGKFDRARRCAQQALRTFKRHKADSDIAKTQVNYANLLHRLDRHRDASKLYAQAADYFSAEGPEFAAALCHYNRANTLVQLFEFPEAERLYTDARPVFAKYEQQLYATGCLYGLAWLHMLAGEFQLALEELTECESEYRKGGHLRELTVCQLDRAESFLGLNLFADAAKAAEEATVHAKRLGVAYEQGKAAFFAAKAAVGLGKTASARSALRRAERLFTKASNPGFLAAVQLTQALLRKGKTKSVTQVRRIREQFRRAQLPLWEAICDLEVISTWPNDQQALRRLNESPAVATVPHLLAARHTIHGDREARRGRMKAAIGRWAQAADILDGVRAKLPPVELRSSYFSGRQQPHLKLIDAESAHNPAHAAAWSERFKTAGVWSPAEGALSASPARRRVRDSLSDLANRMTAMSGVIADSSGRRTLATGPAPAAFVRLQRQLRDELAALEKPRQAADSIPKLVASIRRAAKDQPVVQFHVGSSDIVAFVTQNGATRAQRYPDGVRYTHQWLGRWRYLMEFISANRARHPHSRLTEERDLLMQFGQWLLPPLELDADAQRVLILPEGPLAGVPWLALDDGSGHLVDRYDVVLAPSVRHHLTARLRRNRAHGSRLFIGRYDDLPHVQAEVATVRERFNGNDLTIHNPCRRSDWPADATEKVWHFAGHAELRRDNPFFSSLMMEDGPMFAADFRLMHSRVELVTLAACRTGQHTGLPGEEATGLVRSLLEMGARNVIASNWAVSDLSTSRWMGLFYDEYLGGAGAACATRLAAQGVREEFPSAFHWAAFSPFGAG